MKLRAVIAAGQPIWAEKTFISTGGGAADPDSRRGFGPTEQWWNVPTENGYVVQYGDNGAGIAVVITPAGQKITRN